jgi:glycosyltransferase involved in cell wall biosynthesis
MGISYKRVTVYTPNLNCEPYIRDCLKSIVNQRWPNMEILISDDGSTDGSLEICREYASKDNRIKLFERGKPSGSCGDINATLEHATGEFICKMDSDDVMIENYWETVLPFFTEEKIGFVSGGMIIMTEKGEDALRFVPPFLWANPLEIFEHGVVFAASPFRLKMFNEVGGWDSGRPHPDWDFWIRCMLAGWKWTYCLKPIYHYRIRQGSVVHTMTSEDKVNTIEYYRKKYKDILAKFGMVPGSGDSLAIGVSTKTRREYDKRG